MQSKAETRFVKRLLIGHCDPGDELQLRIVYVVYVWSGKWGGRGFENRSSIVSYMQTISMNNLWRTCINESKM